MNNETTRRGFFGLLAGVAAAVGLPLGRPVEATPAAKELGKGLANQRLAHGMAGEQTVWFALFTPEESFTGGGGEPLFGGRRAPGNARAAEDEDGDWRLLYKARWGPVDAAHHLPERVHLEVYDAPEGGRLLFWGDCWNHTAIDLFPGDIYQVNGAIRLG